MYNTIKDTKTIRAIEFARKDARKRLGLKPRHIQEYQPYMLCCSSDMIKRIRCIYNKQRSLTIYDIIILVIVVIGSMWQN